MPENSAGAGGMSVGVISLDLVIKNKINEQLEEIKSKLTGSLSAAGDKAAGKLEGAFSKLRSAAAGISKPIEKAAQDTAQSIQRAFDSGISADPEKRLEQELDLTVKKAQMLRRELQELKADQEYLESHPTVGNNRYLKDVRSKVLSVGQQLISAENRIDRLRGRLSEVSAESADTGEALESSAERGRSAFSGLFSAIKSGSSGGFRIFRSVGQRAVDSIRSKLTKLHSAFSGLTKPAARFGRTIRNAARRIFMMAGILALFRKLRSLLSDAAHSNEQFAKSLNEVKANLTVAFRPIIEAAMPALNRLMSTLAAATRSAAVFINTLFGSTYSKSLETVKGLKAVSKEAKALLAPFDEINNLSSDESGTDYSDIADSLLSDGKAESLAQRLKEILSEGNLQALGSAAAVRVNRIFERINKAVNSARPKLKRAVEGVADMLNAFMADTDWESIGRTAGNALSAGLELLSTAAERFDWAGLGSAVAGSVNGLKSSFSFKSVGEFAANSLNGIFTALRKIIEDTRWADWAADLTAGINTFIAMTDWDNIGTTLGSAFDGVLDFIYTALSDFDAEKAAEALFTSFNGFIKTVNWNKLGASVSAGITKALDFLGGTLEGVEWDEVGSGIADFFNGIDFGSIFRGLWRVFKGIVSAIPGILVGLVREIDFGNAAIAFGAVFGAKFLTNLLTYFKTGAAQKLSSIGSVISEKLSTGISGLGIGTKMVAGIGAALAGWQIGSWIREKWGPQIDEALEPLWEGIFGEPKVLSDDENERAARRAINKTLYGIDSDRKLTNADISKAYGEGYEAMESLAGKFGVKVPKAFTDAYKKYINDRQDEIEKSAHDSVSWFSDGIKNSSMYADSAMYAVASGVKKELESIKAPAFSSGFSTVSWFSDGISKGSSKSFNAAAGAAAGVGTALNRSGDNAYISGQNAVGELAKGIEESRAVTDAAAGLVVGSVSGIFGTVSTEAERWGRDICDLLSGGIVDYYWKVTDAANTVAQQVRALLHFSEPDKGPLSDFHTYMPDMMKLMAKGIRDNSWIAVRAAGEVAAEISGEVSGIRLRAPALQLVTGRTQAASGASEAARSEELSALRYELRQAIREGFYSAADGSSDSGDILVFIDSDQVAARVERRRAQRAKMTGGR